MKITRTFVVPIIIIGLGAAGFALLASMRQPPEQKAEIDRTPLVDVYVIETQPYQLVVDSQGVSEPLSRTQLIANVSGVVVSYNAAFTAGGMVTRGEVLVEIEKLDYLSALKSAEASQKSKLVLKLQQTSGHARGALRLHHYWAFVNHN
jgi:hypothetical protein